MIAIHLALMLAANHVLVDGCSDTDATVPCMESCINHSVGGTACQTNNFYNASNPPWTFNWQCACVNDGTNPAFCSAWKIVGCGTWCFMVWEAVGCQNPEPCACSAIAEQLQVCYAVAECVNRPEYPVCTNPFQHCLKRVAITSVPISVTGSEPCCP